MRITIYSESGEINTVMDISEQNIPLNIGEGQSYIEGWYYPKEFYIKDGLPIPMPQKPGEWAVFDYDNEIWIDPRTADDLVKELADAKADAIKKINAGAGVVRGKYITIAPGMDMQYVDKERQAIAFLADPEPDVTKYPNIYAEVGLYSDQDTPERVATIIVDMANMWRTVSANLEFVRLSHIAQIETATSVDAIDPIIQSFNESIQAFG